MSQAFKYKHKVCHWDALQEGPWLINMLNFKIRTFCFSLSQFKLFAFFNQIIQIKKKGWKKCLLFTDLPFHPASKLGIGRVVDALNKE